LSVGSGHDDTVQISGILVLWIVNAEHAVPHGWPKVVSAETEEKLENGAVELMTIAWVVSILLVNPVGESWLFIVQEDTTVLNRGSTLGADGVDGVDVLVGLWWDVGPVVPWRDTDLLR